MSLSLPICLFLPPTRELFHGASIGNLVTFPVTHCYTRVVIKSFLFLYFIKDNRLKHIPSQHLRALPEATVNGNACTVDIRVADADNWRRFDAVMVVVACQRTRGKYVVLHAKEHKIIPRLQNYFSQSMFTKYICNFRLLLFMLPKRCRSVLEE